MKFYYFKPDYFVCYQRVIRWDQFLPFESVVNFRIFAHLTSQIPEKKRFLRSVNPRGIVRRFLASLYSIKN